MGACGRCVAAKEERRPVREKIGAWSPPRVLWRTFGQPTCRTWRNTELQINTTTNNLTRHANDVEEASADLGTSRGAPGDGRPAAAPAPPDECARPAEVPAIPQAAPNRIRVRKKFAKGRHKAGQRASAARRRGCTPEVSDDWLAVTSKDLAAAKGCPVDKETKSHAARRETGGMQTFVLQCGQVLSFCELLRGESLQLVYAMLLRLVGKLSASEHQPQAIFYDSACKLLSMARSKRNCYPLPAPHRDVCKSGHTVGPAAPGQSPLVPHALAGSGLPQGRSQAFHRRRGHASVRAI